MKITTAWYFDLDEDGGPTLVAAYDEYTEDAWNGRPGFFADELEKYDASKVRPMR